MAIDDAAKGIVAVIEEAAFEECKAKGRYDLLDAIREGGYDLTDEPDGSMRFVVAGETILTVTLGRDGAIQRLN